MLIKLSTINLQFVRTTSPKAQHSISERNLQKGAIWVLLPGPQNLSTNVKIITFKN
jgi:hypothetical protein